MDRADKKIRNAALIKCLHFVKYLATIALHKLAVKSRDNQRNIDNFRDSLKYRTDFMFLIYSAMKACILGFEIYPVEV